MTKRQKQLEIALAMNKALWLIKHPQRPYGGFDLGPCWGLRVVTGSKLFYFKNVKEIRNMLRKVIQS
jgi:hypothetical protein